MFPNARRPVLFSLACGAMIVCALVLQQMISIMMLSRAIRTESMRVHDAYIGIVQEIALPLADHPAVDGALSSFLPSWKQFLAMDEAQLDVGDMLKEISALQLSLATAADILSNISALQQNKASMTLQKEVTKNGEVYLLVQNYNLRAMQWNMTLKTRIGSLRSRFVELHPTALPILYTDRAWETEITIKL